MPGARRYFRVIELEGEGFACRAGRSVLGMHPDLGLALAHAMAEAEANRPAEVLVHRDGQVRTHAVLDG